MSNSDSLNISSSRHRHYDMIDIEDSSAIPENLNDTKLSSLYHVSPRLRGHSWEDEDSFKFSLHLYLNKIFNTFKDYKRYVPILKWSKKYNIKKYLSNDIYSGLTLGIVLVPQAMAYSLLADLDAEYGLYTAIFPAMIYMILGGSKHLSIGPTAMISLVTAESVGKIINPIDDADKYANAASTVAFLVGLILLLFNSLGLGELVSSFLSDSVLAGFTTSAAILIGLSQIKYLFGITIKRGEIIEFNSNI